jgi:hypothetical protein
MCGLMMVKPVYRLGAVVVWKLRSSNEWDYALFGARMSL